MGGKASQIEQTGLATAKAYMVQREAIGPQATALIKVIDEIGTKGVKITPDFLITGGGEQGNTALILQAWLANAIMDQQKEKMAAVTSASAPTATKKDDKPKMAQ